MRQRPTSQACALLHRTALGATCCAVFSELATAITSITVCYIASVAMAHKVAPGEIPAGDHPLTMSSVSAHSLLAMNHA